MRITIATGIYPPDIGGPAQYARETERAWGSVWHTVAVCRFNALRFLPSGIRHLAFFLWVLWRSVGADFIFIPDTFSAAVPAVAVGKLLRKKTIIRTGGDFLWEQFVERTGDLVLLRNFYQTRRAQLNAKERMIFRFVRWALQNASAVVFSTEWQKNIFAEPYRLDAEKCFVVENYYASCTARYSDVLENIRTKKVFVGGTRKLKWKNTERLRRAFYIAKARRQEHTIDIENAPHMAFKEKIKNAYAVILASLGDISPNMILDALRTGTPFILTRETGLYERLKNIAVFVDPESERDIAEKVLWLSDERNYTAQTAKVRAFSFTHSWDEIAHEILAIQKQLGIC